MKKGPVLILLTILFTNILLAQDREKYDGLSKDAFQLYKDKEYLKSAQKYSEAFATLGNKGTVYARYNAACSWALAGEKDSAFVQLFRIADKQNYTDLKHLTTDSDLNSLHSDKRWGKVVEIVKSNKAKAEANFDKNLMAILDTIYEDDQKYRLELDSIQKKYGMESDEVKAHWNIINKKDSINLIKVKKILDERGWLGADVVGQQGNSALFLVIQHSDLNTQLQYLPMMRDAVKKGNARGSSLALLEDRIALRKGEKQIYGSQIGYDNETGEYYVLPLIDPDNIDKRRAEVGLAPIQSYISIWGATWDVEEYKKKLPEYEAKEKR